MNATEIFSEHDLAAVELHNQIHPRIKVRPVYYELGYSPSPKIYGRQIVLTRVLEMLEELPSQYGILIYDVYRPRAVQGVLFEVIRNEVRKLMPHLTEDENFIETRKYVSLPSIVGNPYCAPHLSGGAIDLTLINSATFQECNMGGPFDDPSEISNRNFYEKKSSLTQEEKEIKTRRDLLQELMESVGFTSHEFEWWHYDLGDILWSKATGQPEAFGPLFGDSEWPE
ncbi:MAG: hypothetical protein K2X50_01965 [Gammaproteobacteria bacterium]|nr:hypothetical protein [Gammaproteobacteria bacterium]